MMKRALLCLCAGVLALGGCSEDDGEPTAASPAPSASAASSTPAPETTEAAPEATCQVRKYVPSTTIVYTRPGARVLVASLPFRVGGGGMVTPGETTFGGVRLATRVTSGNGPLDLTHERSVLQSMGGPASAADLESGTLSIPADRATERGAYVAYQTARYANGRFRVLACGAPYNDGTAVETVRGTYRALQKLSPTRVVRCDAVPADAGQAAAQRAGCDG